MAPTFCRIGSPRPTLARNHNRAPKEFTVLITGQPRGGTTMVAAVVDALGVYLGPYEDLRDFHFEDQVMHNPDLSQVYPCIKKRNAEHAIWGWKDPAGVDSMQQLTFALRNPRIIIVFRDLLATIHGEMRFDEMFNSDHQRSPEQLAEAFITRERRTIDYVFKTQLPTLLVSYERAMEQPDMFIEDICGFLDLETTVEQRLAAKNRIGRGYIISDWRTDVPTA